MYDFCWENKRYSKLQLAPSWCRASVWTTSLLVPSGSLWDTCFYSAHINTVYMAFFQLPLLLQVSMIIESDGSVRYGLPKESKLSTRGTKFSVPKPKGGRHANLIFREDQKEFQRPQRQQKSEPRIVVGCMFVSHSVNTNQLHGEWISRIFFDSSHNMSRMLFLKKIVA